MLGAPTAEQIETSLRNPDAERFLILDGKTRAGLVALAQVDPPWLFEIRRVVSSYEHRGIGLFACRWTMRYIFEQRHAHRAYLEVHAKNIRARSLYEYCGFKYEGTYRDGARNSVTGKFEDLCVYGLLEDGYRTSSTR